MRVVNRTAVTVIGAAPYEAWTRQHDADALRAEYTGSLGSRCLAYPPRQSTRAA